MITTIVRPKSVPEAVRERRAPGSAFLGGGTWLNTKASAVTRLISLESLGLGGIEETADGFTIGAMATLQQIVDAAFLPAGLRDAARLMASRTLRNMCTLGGELGLHQDDSALIPVLMALGATIGRTVSRRPALWSRPVTAPIMTWLEKPTDDLILSVSVPRTECAVTAVSRTSHSPRSVVVAAALAASGGTVSVVVCDCRGTRLAISVSRGSERTGVESAVGALFMPKPDMHASAAYKRYIGGVLAADMVARL